MRKPLTLLVIGTVIGLTLSGVVGAYSADGKIEAFVEFAKALLSGFELLLGSL